MDRPTILILAVTTVLAWSAATHFVPPTWWGAVVTIAVGALFAYPLRGSLGLSTAQYLRFGVALVVVVPLVHAGTEGRPQLRLWITGAVLVFAVAGLLLKQARQRRA